MKWYFVYIMTNRSKTLYTGVTRSIVVRARQHKEREHEGFTSRYQIDRVVYVECFTDIDLAISREKEIKKMRRLEKIELIVSRNPTWRDLSEDWDDSMKNYAVNKGR
jgi:putative endonuclease